MSDTYPNNDEQSDDDRVVQLRRSQIRALEEQAKQGRDATQRAQAAERRLAFAEAGVALDDPKTKWFVKGYDGEETAEAIRQAATEAGFIGEQVSPQEPTVPPAEQAAHQRLAAAAAGSDPPNNSTLTADDLARAQTPEDVMRMVNDLGMARAVE